MDFLGAEPPVDEPPVNEPPARMEGAIMAANPMIKIEIDTRPRGVEVGSQHSPPVTHGVEY